MLFCWWYEKELLIVLEPFLASYYVAMQVLPWMLCLVKHLIHFSQSTMYYFRLYWSYPMFVFARLLHQMKVSYIAVLSAFHPDLQPRQNLVFH